VSIAVADKLNDQTLAQTIYADISRSDNVSDDLRLTAIKKLVDQQVLADIAKSNMFAPLRKAAVENMTDHSVLIEIINGDKDIYSCSWVESINEGDDYFSAAKNNSLDLRKTASKRLADLR